MVAYLIATEGLLQGMVLELTESEEWILGRDPDACFQSIEDPMVSRKQARLFLSEDQYFIENLSTVNPTLLNGKAVVETQMLHEGDTILLGNNTFRFSFTDPRTEEVSAEETPAAQEEDWLSQLPLGSGFEETPWLLKVVAGPNQGAEFGMRRGETRILGKDPTICDVIFQDMSVSREHLKIHISDENVVTVEDLKSRNGTIIEGQPITTSVQVPSQTLITLGTTTILLIDRKAVEETLYSPLPPPPQTVEAEPETPEPVAVETAPPTKDWKELFIPTRYLVLASVFSSVAFIILVSIIALFRAQPVMDHYVDNSSEIRRVLHHFPGVQYSYQKPQGNLFLVGHVLTQLQHSELIYLLQGIQGMGTIEDNIIIDESVWDNMNALLNPYPQWKGILITSDTPGNFVLSGYLKTEEESTNLSDFVNQYFPYLNQLQNQVVVETTLSAEVQSMLTEEGFANVTHQFNNGELILAGRAGASDERKFSHLVQKMAKIPGVRQVRNIVIFAGPSTARIDLTGRYTVTGNSKVGNINAFVVINGKILAKGDTVDGMMISMITPHEVYLEKGIMKYKIDYNLQ